MPSNASQPNIPEPGGEAHEFGEQLMLILTRRIGEALMIGRDVTVTVLGAKGNQVQIGVNAPKDVPVHRQEIYNRVQQEKMQQPE